MTMMLEINGDESDSEWFIMRECHAECVGKLGRGIELPMRKGSLGKRGKISE